MAEGGRRITIDLEDVQRMAREVVATTPAPRIAETLVERLGSMQTPSAVKRRKPPSDAVRAAVRSKLRRLGA